MHIERRLVTIRRRVSADRAVQYASLWSALSALMTAEGAHAWRFVSSGDPELHLEFLEFESSAEPRSLPEAKELLDRLAAETGAPAVEEWLEKR